MNNGMSRRLAGAILLAGLLLVGLARGQDAPQPGDGDAATTTTAAAMRDAELADEQLRAQWTVGPAEALTDQRGRIGLDGLWRFVPAAGQTLEAPAGFGYARVPGAWNRDAVVLRGTGGPWETFEPEQLAQAWYEKAFDVPAEWAGRAVELIVERVSTDASVYVNGIEAGRIYWPAGRVRIDGHLRPGETNQLRLFVVAEQEAENVAAALRQERPADGGTLENRGLIGSVSLLSRPTRAHVVDLLVRPSTRRQRLEVDLELADVAAAGDVVVRAEMLDEQGVVEKTFEQVLTVERRAAQTVTVGWDWPEARRWDVGQPNRYTMRLALSGAVEDTIVQPFGFREFWIEGRRFFLNGTEIRLRPNTLHAGATPRQLLERGYNFGELWPVDRSRRGSDTPGAQFIAEADAVGLPISGRAMHMETFVNDIERWREDASVRESYRRLMEVDLRRWRNHPSIVMWGHTGNALQNDHDGDPWLLGRAEWSVDQQYVERQRNVREAIAMIKAVDPVRPVFAHHGTYHGEVYTSNLFLNFRPLQEREEYLSAWARNGQMPFMAVQFGMPLYASVMRGRGGYEQAGRSEPLMTEWAAAYLGNEAYALEPDDYRALLRERYRDGEMAYDAHVREGGAERRISGAPAMRRVYELFARNTWRSWRTMGISGGMVPWHHDDTNDVPMLREVNGPSLAWIAGAGETPLPGEAGLAQAHAFTEKDHSYAAGATVIKQAALLNDHRSAQEVSWRWRAVLGDAEIASGGSETPLVMEPAETRLLPIEFALPEQVAGEKVQGRIELSARVGPDEHHDSFGFEVFAPIPPAEGVVTVFDPVGQTSAMLQSLGYTVQPWTSGAAAGEVVVIGRRALSDGDALPGPIGKYLREGGRVVLFGQDPQWMRYALQLRTAAHVSRRVFRVNADHPVTAGLDDNDLRDWNGQSRLVAGYPAYPGFEATPLYGWSWGGRGGVSSAAIEIPHRSGMRALLRCEWDLAYSPLLELDYGRGRLTLCMLDLEDHVENTPAARKLARQLMEHVRSGAVAGQAVGVIYLGDEAGDRLLDWMGVRHTRVEVVERDAELVIVEGEAVVRNDALAAYVGRGGKVLVLRRGSGGTGVLGAEYEVVENHRGAMAAPAWPEAAWLTASDLRWRTTGQNIVLKETEKVQVAAEGQLGRMEIGRGVAVFAQVSPEATPADEKRYLRYTRWRQTRALAQVLANMGATFHHDDRLIELIEKPNHAWLLAGQWDARLTDARPQQLSGAAHADPGMGDFAKVLVQVDAPMLEVETVPVPARMEAYEGQWTWADGEAVFRREVEVPQRLAGRELFLSLGRVGGSAIAFFNGERIGQTEGPSAAVGFRVPGELVRAGKNVIALRLWNASGPGGLLGPPEHLVLRTLGPAANFYHDDYIGSTVSLGEAERQAEAHQRRLWWGDDPYRYRNW